MTLLKAWELNMVTDLPPKGAKLMGWDADLASGKTLCSVTHLRKGVELMENRGAFLPRASSSL